MTSGRRILVSWASGLVKTLSEQFGDGRLADSRGSQVVAAIMGQARYWVDYSGLRRSGQD